jgi:hypothetical protein
MLKGYKFRLEATGDEVPRLLDATTKSTSEPLIISNGKEEYMQWWQNATQKNMPIEVHHYNQDGKLVKIVRYESE